MSRQAQAKREFARRELARRNLTDYCCYVDPGAGWGDDPFLNNHYRAPHLQHVARKLEALERGDIRRMMLFMPNRHWKSSLCSMKFVSWFIGKRYSAGQPHQAMLISHTGDKADEFSEYSRNLVRDTDSSNFSRYRNVFPNIELSKTRQSAREWGLRQLDNPAVEEPFPTVTTGSMTAPPTGSGADLLIIDDPIKSSRDARSASVQQMHMKAWQEGLRTRLNSPKSAVLITLTRWNINDIAGQLLRLQNDDPLADQWEVVVLPALAYTSKERAAARRFMIPVPDIDPLGRAPGEALWPSRFPREFHLTTRANSPSAFSSIGQQMPVSEGGNLMSRENFRIIPALTAEEAEQVTWCIALDAAYKEKQLTKDDPDFNVVGLLGIRETATKQIDIILGGLLRTQKGIDAAKQIIPAFAQTVGKVLGKPVPIIGDGATLDRILLDDIRSNKAMLRWAVHSLANPRLKRRLGTFRGDKVEKSEAWRARAMGGDFYVVEESWLGGHLAAAFAGQLGELFGDEPLTWHEKLFTEVEGFPDWPHDDMIDFISTGYHYLSGNHQGGVEHLPGSIFDLDADTLRRIKQQRQAVAA